MCLWAEGKEEDNDDDYHYNMTMLMMTTETTTNRLWHQSICLNVYVRISFPVVNCFGMSLLWSFSYISRMFQMLAST
jgi:hypothetical protein